MRYTSNTIRPVTVHMARTKCKRIMNQRRINHVILFGPVKQIRQIAKVSITSTDTIPCTILIQNEYLSRTKPTLKREIWWKHVSENIWNQSSPVPHLPTMRTDRSVDSLAKDSEANGRASHDRTYTDRHLWNLPFRVFVPYRRHLEFSILSNSYLALAVALAYAIVLLPGTLPLPTDCIRSHRRWHTGCCRLRALHWRRSVRLPDPCPPLN